MLILNNQDLESACNTQACIEALYDGLKSYSRGDAARRPRIDLFTPTSRPDEFACFSSMEGIVRGKYYAIRLKPDIISWPHVGGLRRRVTYCYQPGLYGGLILLFCTENAELVAIMNDGYLQHMRVGVTAALGARYLARADSEIAGILGSGGMARSFAMGFAAVRKLRLIKAYSPNREHLKSYCEQMSQKLGIDVIPKDTPQAVIQGSDIVASCTNSLQPVLEGGWLEPGMFVANVANRELDQEAFRRITLVGYLTFDRDPLDLSGFSDHNFDIRTEVMVYLSGQPHERERIPKSWYKAVNTLNARWVPCVDWKTESPLGRESDEDITFLAEVAGSNFQSGLASSGIQGLQFACVTGRAYELASAMGLGKRLDLELFLQDITT